MLPSYTGNISKLIYRCHLANPIRKKADHGLDVRTCRSNSRMTQNQTQTKRRKAITGSCTERKTRQYFWNLIRAFLTGSHWPSSLVLRMKGHFCTNSFPRRKPVGSPFLSYFRRFFYQRWGILSTKIGKTLRWFGVFRSADYLKNILRGTWVIVLTLYTFNLQVTDTKGYTNINFNDMTDWCLQAFQTNSVSQVQQG